MDKMPLEASDFPQEVQAAFFIYDLLSDRWDGMNGVYLGKDWSSAQFLLELYDIQEAPEVIKFAKAIESFTVKHLMQENEKKRKAEERRNKASGGGGKNYTHNVKG